MVDWNGGMDRTGMEWNGRMQHGQIFRLVRLSVQPLLGLDISLGSR